MKILLGYFNAKFGKEYFKPTTGNVRLYQNRNDNGAGVVTFPTSKNLVVNSTFINTPGPLVTGRLTIR